MLSAHFVAYTHPFTLTKSQPQPLQKRLYFRNLWSLIKMLILKKNVRRTWRLLHLKSFYPFMFHVFSFYLQVSVATVMFHVFFHLIRAS